MFQPVSSKVSFPQMEEAILRLWRGERSTEHAPTRRGYAPALANGGHSGRAYWPRQAGAFGRRLGRDFREAGAASPSTGRDSLGR